MAPRTQEQNEAIREQTQQQIQEAAFELFAKRGFANTPISAIAKKADVSKGLIYHYFDSKEAILEAIFHYWVEVTGYMFDFPSDLIAGQKVEQMLEAIFEFIEDNPEVSRFMTALALQPDAIAAAKSSVDEIREKQIQVIVHLLKELNYANPEKEAYYLGAKLDGITLGYLTLGDEYPLEAMKQKLLEEYVTDEND